MKRLLSILVCLILINSINAQNDAVLSQGHFLISVGAGIPQSTGIPVELTVTYGTLDNVFEFKNLHFGIEYLCSFNFFNPSNGSKLIMGGGPNFHYTLFDHFDLFAGFNAGWGLDQYLTKMGSTSTPNYDTDDLFQYFVNVGIRYSFNNFGVYAKGNYSKISFGAVGVFLKL
jgi:hypothetical protein